MVKEKLDDLLTLASAIPRPVGPCAFEMAGKADDLPVILPPTRSLSHGTPKPAKVRPVFADTGFFLALGIMPRSIPSDGNEPECELVTPLLTTAWVLWNSLIAIATSSRP